MNEEKLKRLVVFCILMETGKGILTKSPSYIAEKWAAASTVPLEVLPQLLDHENREKYRKWLETWILLQERGS